MENSIADSFESILKRETREHIVKCVNSHDALVGALEFLLGVDLKVDVSIGGNPDYVHDKMSGFNSLLHQIKEQ